MKSLIVLLLLISALILGYQGYIYGKFDAHLRQSEAAFYAKDYGRSLSAIDKFRQDRWYKPIKKYPRLDIFEIDKIMNYQKGRIMAEIGNLKDAFAFFDKCADAKDSELAFRCLYQQGNLALYQGNSSVAEKKWQAALEKNNGGHDFDSQVNLELQKSEKNKAQSAADAAMLTHRRSRDRYFYLRPPTSKDAAIRP